MPVRSGKGLLDLIAKGVSWTFDHGVLVGEDAEIVADLFQTVQGVACLFPEMQPGERVRASAMLHERVQALEQRGLVLLGAVENRPLLIRAGQAIQRPVVAVVVQRPKAETYNPKATRKKKL